MMRPLAVSLTTVQLPVAHVAPGETGEIIWKFNRKGRFHFACLVAGHYEAGMAGTITVTSR